jgi:hypothetical protein
MVNMGLFQLVAYRVHFDLVDKCILLRVNKRLKKPPVDVLFPIRPLILPYRRGVELAARYYFLLYKLTFDGQNTFVSLRPGQTDAGSGSGAKQGNGGGIKELGQKKMKPYYLFSNSG